MVLPGLLLLGGKLLKSVTKQGITLFLTKVQMLTLPLHWFSSSPAPPAEAVLFSKWLCVKLMSGHVL